MGAGIEAGDVDRAGIREPEAKGALEEGGLAGAIGAEQAEDFPRADAKGDGIDGADGAVGFYQVTDGKARFGVIHSRKCGGPCG